MHKLISRTDVDIDRYLNGKKDPPTLADIVLDGLLMAWDEPCTANWGVSHELLQKWDAWTNASGGKSEAKDKMTELGKSTKKEKLKLKYGKLNIREVSPELGENAPNARATLPTELGRRDGQAMLDGTAKKQRRVTRWSEGTL
jgi:hypothetical protein